MQLSTIIKKKLKRLSLRLRRGKLLMVLYTLLVLFVGVLIGGHYDGCDETGTYYYHVFGITFYGGMINND